jgi:hypothetical protein
MLEKPEERVRLLKTGLTGKQIERIYIESNNFKIAHAPAVLKLVEIDMTEKKKTCASHEITVRCV